jgi:hypothetical protein
MPHDANPTNSDFSFGTAGITGPAPYLQITTTGGGSGVPEPGTLSLAGLVLLAFGLVSRRRKIGSFRCKHA